ncbi:MAG: TorF family putative porin [Arenicella sp.]|nr:TorF family putative porin [Arenicella sp.]
MKKSLKILTTLPLASVLMSPVAQAEMSANVAIQSDYVWRGISQNQEDPSIQGGFDYAHESGFYAGVWGASVDFGGDESTEMDLYAGWSTELENGLGIDIGIIEYTYHGGPAASGDFTEYVLGLSYSGFGVTYYSGDEFDDNFEVSYGYDFEAGVSLGATYGDYDTYNFYQVGVSGEVEGVGLDLSYWDTDIDDDPLADGRVVLTVSKEF